MAQTLVFIVVFQAEPFLPGMVAKKSSFHAHAKTPHQPKSAGRSQRPRRGHYLSDGFRASRCTHRYLSRSIATFRDRSL